MSESQFKVSNEDGCTCRPPPPEPKVPRPRNAFILFRMSYQKTLPCTIANIEKSKIIASAWNSLSPEDRMYWENMSSEERREHKLKYPDYIYNKPKSMLKKKAAKRGRKPKFVCTCKNKNVKEEHFASPKSDSTALLIRSDDDESDYTPVLSYSGEKTPVETDAKPLLQTTKSSPEYIRAGSKYIPETKMEKVHIIPEVSSVYQQISPRSSVSAYTHNSDTPMPVYAYQPAPVMGAPLTIPAGVPVHFPLQNITCVSPLSGSFSSAGSSQPGSFSAPASVAKSSFSSSTALPSMFPASFPSPNGSFSGPVPSPIGSFSGPVQTSYGGFVGGPINYTPVVMGGPYQPFPTGSSPVDGSRADQRLWAPSTHLISQPAMASQPYHPLFSPVAEHAQRAVPQPLPSVSNLFK